jgi:hypothetical protein
MLAVVPARAVCAREIHGGLGKHHAAFVIEVTGHRVQALDQPEREPAEFLGARADAAVDERAWLIQQALRERLDVLTGDRRA